MKYLKSYNNLALQKFCLAFAVTTKGRMLSLGSMLKVQKLHDQLGTRITIT